MVTFNISGIIKKIDAKAEQVVTESLKEMSTYARQISPLDTGKYVISHEVSPVTVTPTRVFGTITNTTPYAIFLEYGVQGRTFNYHRGPRKGPRKVIYTGVGNRTYARTADKFLPIIIKKLKGA